MDKKNNKKEVSSMKKYRLILTIVLLLLLTCQDVSAANPVSNPTITKDSSMQSGQVVTWDTISMGSYPQTEIKSTDSVYKALTAAADWDSSNDLDLNGERYHRIKKSDAVNVRSRAVNQWIYFCDTWAGSGTYRYFKYEPVTWRVLSVDDTKNTALVLSDKVLNAQYYHNTDGSVTWATSTVRSWMNDKLYEDTFTKEETDAILTTSLTNYKNSFRYKNKEDAATEDKLFLLEQADLFSSSSDSFYKYTAPTGDRGSAYGFIPDAYKADEGRTCKNTDYAKAMGALSASNGNAVWMMRTPAYYVEKYGDAISGTGQILDMELASNDLAGPFGIRPAMTIDLSKTDCYKIGDKIRSTNKNSITLKSEYINKNAADAAFSIGASSANPLSYYSSDESVAAVSASGKVTLKNSGIIAIMIADQVTGDMRWVQLYVAPKKITAISAKRTSSKSIKVSWTPASTNVDYYRVCWYNSTKGKWVQKALLNGGKTSYTYTGASPLKTYKFKVRPLLDRIPIWSDGYHSCDGAFSSVVSVKPVLSKVTGVSVKRKKTSAVLRWKKVTGASGYKIYRKKSGKWVSIKTIKKGSTRKAVYKTKKKNSYKIRAYRIMSGKKVYGPYSKVVKK